MSSYLLTECIDDGKYDAVECQCRYVMYENQKNRHGPARVTEWSDRTVTRLFGRLAGSRRSADFVHCIRCLSWPTQAADWPTRHRNYTAGRTQQPLIVLSAMDVMWFRWHIVSVDEMNG